MYQPYDANIKTRSVLKQMPKSLHKIKRLVVWWVHSLTKCPANCITVWFACWLSVWLPGWWVDLFEWLLDDWNGSWLLSCLPGWLSGWLTGCVPGWQAGSPSCVPSQAPAPHQILIGLSLSATDNTSFFLLRVQNEKWPGTNDTLFFLGAGKLGRRGWFPCRERSSGETWHC